MSHEVYQIIAFAWGFIIFNKFSANFVLKPNYLKPNLFTASIHFNNADHR